MEQREGIKKKAKGNVLFDILYDIKVNKTKTLLDDENGEYHKAFVPFMVLKFLSMNHGFVPYIEHINQYQHLLSKRELYLLLCDAIPYCKSFDPFISKTQINAQNETAVAEYYQIPKSEAREYISIMGIEWASSIKETFGGTDE